MVTVARMLVPSDIFKMSCKTHKLMCNMKSVLATYSSNLRPMQNIGVVYTNNGPLEMICLVISSNLHWLSVLSI